jgi:hypothetical protein
MRRRWRFALLTLAAGCGGSDFSAAIPTGDASADASESSDAHAALDGRDAALDGGDADATSPADSAVVDSAGSGPETGSVDAASGDSSNTSDATGIVDTGLDADAGDAGPDARDAQPDVAAEACVPVLYFLDADGDGYGGTSTSTGCAPPTTGTWVTTGGDCDDSNATVNPGQTAFFAVGYDLPGTTTVSFDYNCDGQETESGSPAKADCKEVSLSCVGSGYVEATPVRSGPSVDPFCGSAQAVTCALTSLVCQAGAPYAVTPIACH